MSLKKLESIGRYIFKNQQQHFSTGMTRSSTCLHSSISSDHSISKQIISDTGVNNIKEHIFSVAPMMEYTDTHMRRLYRMISKKSILYTEMITTNTLVRTDDPYRYLEASFPVEEPLVLQLGQ